MFIVHKLNRDVCNTRSFVLCTNKTSHYVVMMVVTGYMF